MSGRIATGSIFSALQAEAGSLVALCAAMPIGGEGVPDWLPLLPAGPDLETYD